MVDLNEIYFFVEVVRAGSFAEAARRLEIPANTIGRHIRQLETRLNNRLLVRTTRKLTLTAIGQIFHDQCVRNIEGLVRASQEATDTQPAPFGPLRVALPAGFFEVVPISCITEFLARYPRISLELVVDHPRVDLADSGIDFAFRPDTLLKENSIRRILFGSRCRLVAAPDYLERHGVPAALAELGRHECLLIATNSSPVTWRLNGPDGCVEVEVNGRLLASSTTLVRQAAIEGLGLALLPELRVRQDIEAGQLVSVLDQYRSDELNFCAVFPDHRHIRQITTIFVDHLRAHLIAISEQPTCLRPTVSAARQ